jgi:hypothetical protein
VLGAAYGGLIGSATDAVKLVRLHLRGGEPLLPADTAAAMRTIIPRGGRLEFGLGGTGRPESATSLSTSAVAADSGT